MIFFTAVLIMLLFATTALKPTLRAKHNTNISNIDIDSIYHQLVIEKKNSASFKCPKDINPYIILAEVVKIDKEDSLYDGPTLRDRGNWVLLRQGSECRLVAKNSYDIDKADAIASEIADTIRDLAGDTASERELFYEFTKYMADNFHYSKDVSKKTKYMNKHHVIIPNDNFTDTYYTDKGINCTGYATITYLVSNKLDIDCKMISTTTHVYNAVKFEDSDDYITFDLTLQNKYAGLGILGNAISKFKYLKSKSAEQTLADAVSNGLIYKPSGIGEFINEFRYYHKNSIVKIE